jgi:hypothetical protein
MLMVTAQSIQTAIPEKQTKAAAILKIITTVALLALDEGSCRFHLSRKTSSCTRCKRMNSGFGPSKKYTSTASLALAGASQCQQRYVVLKLRASSVKLYAIE